MAGRKHWRRRARRYRHLNEQLERAIKDAEQEVTEAKLTIAKMRLERLEAYLGIDDPLVEKEFPIGEEDTPPAIRAVE